MIKMGIYELLCFCDRLSHENEEQRETIEELQTLLKYRTKENRAISEENEKIKSHLTIAENDYKNCYAENIRLSEKNNKLHAELSDSKNDLQQAVNEIKLLNKQIDKLIAENNDLRLKNKMLTKIGLNSYYGLYACKKHCCYADTDSIKETNDNDDNN